MRVPYRQAIAFLSDHGNIMHASLTVEGIIATHWVRDHSDDNAPVEMVGDTWFEETVVFDVDEYGRVDGTAIRNFLGY